VGTPEKKKENFREECIMNFIPNESSSKIGFIDTEYSGGSRIVSGWGRSTGRSFPARGGLSFFVIIC